MILDYIREFIDKYGYSPSVRDIMKGCGFNSTSTVANRLQSLKAQGKIDYQPRLARSIRVL